MIRVLVVAAWGEELTRLQALLDVAPAVRDGVSLVAVGVGLVDAGLGAGRAIVQTEPDAVLLIGTAGLLPRPRRSALEVGSAAVVSRIALAAACADGETYFPGPMAQEVLPDDEFAAALKAAAAIPRAAVACTLAITRDATIAQRIADGTHCDLENLEAFAVARAAAAADVPFAAILGIANHVGPAGHTQWKANGAKTAAVACEAAMAWLKLR